MLLVAPLLLLLLPDSNHKFDMAVINGFILFKEHQAQFPDNEALKRPSQYSLGDFWEEIVGNSVVYPIMGSWLVYDDLTDVISYLPSSPITVGT